VSPRSANYLEVVHRLPGRLRLEVRPAPEGAVEHLVAEAERVRGIISSARGASGRTLVVRFDAGRISEQTLLTRLALSLSALRGYEPVRLIKGDDGRSLGRAALTAGATAGAAALLASVAPGGRLARTVGWAASLATLGAVGESTVRDLSRGKARPEALALAHLLRRIGTPGAASGALLSWLLYFGGALAEQVRGARPAALELRPVQIEHKVGDDEEGTHMEIITRPVQERGAAEGSLLSPATVVSAALGSLVFALKQGTTGTS